LLFSFQELRGRSRAKAELLRQKEGLQVQLNQQRESLARANGLLAERSTETVDLCVCYFDLKAKLAVAQGEVTSLVEKTQGLEDELARVSTERDSLKAEAEREAAAT
jgi:chromosome segregation ATPase